jgi:predicted  nucleic acid-binding Zn-ribbon protein
MDAEEDLNTLKRLLVELELKVASLEEQVGSQHSTMQDVLTRLHRLERELKERE